MRALLEGDRCYDDDYPQVILDDDCGHCAPCGCGCDEEPPTDDGTMLQVRLRVRDGITDDGNPRFVWEPILAGPAITYEERTEYDAEAGVTIITATTTIANTSEVVEVPETASVVQPATGTVWKVTGAKTYADRIELKMSRIWSEAPPLDQVP